MALRVEVLKTCILECAGLGFTSDRVFAVSGRYD